MNVLKVKLYEETMGATYWYISTDKIAEYYYNGLKTKIGLTTGNWIYLDGDKTAELTKLLTIPGEGKVFTL